LLQRARKGELDLYMNMINVLEIYYGVYREDGQEVAEETLSRIQRLPIIIVNELTDSVFKESGRLKANYKLSLADSITIAEAKARNASLVTADHQDFDAIEEKGEVEFCWIR
jgi:predicted nucleic acid-binding protein